jgi:pilus assembly protein CpaB
MIARRLIIALLAAIVVSGSFTFWLSRHFAHSRPMTTDQLRYVAITKKMEAGVMLAAGDVQLIKWPSGVPLEGAFTREEDVIGRILLYPLSAGEPLLERQLSAPGSNAGLSGKIPEGMRALSLKSDQVVGVAGYLLPGTHVDVLVTFHTPSSPDPITLTVLQDAEILTAGQKMQPDPEGKASTVDVVTILATPQDAEKVVMASAQGTVHFILRNGSDHIHVDNPPTQMSSLDGLALPKAVTRAPVKSESNLTHKAYSVQITQGDKQTVELF